VATDTGQTDQTSGNGAAQLAEVALLGLGFDADQWAGLWRDAIAALEHARCLHIGAKIEGSVGLWYGHLMNIGAIKLNTMELASTHIKTFGSTLVPRCQAHSKRSGEQCRKAAMRGKRVCRTHGGASTGPKTQAGKARCAQAKTVHGRETRVKRQRRSEKLKELRLLEQVMNATGMTTPTL